MNDLKQEQDKMADFRKRMNDFRRCPTAQEEQEASQKKERKEQE